jgi:hypothetical protein
MEGIFLFTATRKGNPQNFQARERKNTFHNAQPTPALKSCRYRAEYGTEPLKDCNIFDYVLSSFSMIIVCSIFMRVEEKCVMLANQYTLQGLGLDIRTFWQQNDLIV